MSNVSEMIDDLMRYYQQNRLYNDERSAQKRAGIINAVQQGAGALAGYLQNRQSGAAQEAYNRLLAKTVPQITETATPRYMDMPDLPGVSIPFSSAKTGEVPDFAGAQTGILDQPEFQKINPELKQKFLDDLESRQKEAQAALERMQGHADESAYRQGQLLNANRNYTEGQTQDRLNRQMKERLGSQEMDLRQAAIDAGLQKEQMRTKQQQQRQQQTESKQAQREAEHTAEKQARATKEQTKTDQQQKVNEAAVEVEIQEDMARAKPDASGIKRTKLSPLGYSRVELAIKKLPLQRQKEKSLELKERGLI